MTTLVEYFKQQSNTANWSYQDQLCGSDGNPLWTSVPTDLVVTMTAVDRRGCPQFTTNTGDGSSQIGADTNGIINVNVTPDTLGGLDAGLYDIRLKIVTDDFTIERVYGRLPLNEGT